MRLSEKVAIITGGGSGIGEVTARLFASEGAAVMLADINGPAAAAVAESINAEGGRATWAETDVTAGSSVGGVGRATLSTFFRLGILFNNAGIQGACSGIQTHGTGLERTFCR